MKLKVDAPEDRKRLNVLIRDSAMSDLTLYKQFVSEQLDSNVDTGTIVEQMLIQFMASDSDFRKFRKQSESDDQPNNKSGTEPHGAEAGNNTRSAWNSKNKQDSSGKSSEEDSGRSVFG